MEYDITDFIEYLHKEKSITNNTEVSYNRDLKALYQFLLQSGVEEIEYVTSDMLECYLNKLSMDGRKAATISRNIASMKSYFRFLYMNGKVQNNPAINLKAPKIERRISAVLSIDEVERLLEQPNLSRGKGIRDKAMLELLYATGIRVSELISLKVEDVDLERRVLRCNHLDKYREIPFGSVAGDAVSRYLLESREELRGDLDTNILFLNCSGTAMSRQGFWKLVKSYGKKAEITSEITPHSLRNSFAIHLLHNGVGVKKVQQMMGHADAASTKLYVNAFR